MSALHGASGARAGAAPGLGGLIDLAQALLRQLPGLLSDRVDLFALELQRAGGVLAQIVAMVLAVAILGVTAWLALWGAILWVLIAVGVPGLPALLAVLVVNLAAAWMAMRRARRLMPLLSLPLTRRHLTFSTVTEPLPEGGPLSAATSARADAGPPHGAKGPTGDADGR